MTGKGELIAQYCLAGQRRDLDPEARLRLPSPVLLALCRQGGPTRRCLQGYAQAMREVKALCGAPSLGMEPKQHLWLQLASSLALPVTSPQPHSLHARQELVKTSHLTTVAGLRAQLMSVWSHVSWPMGHTEHTLAMYLLGKFLHMDELIFYSCGQLIGLPLTLCLAVLSFHIWYFL